MDLAQKSDDPEFTEILQTSAADMRAQLAGALPAPEATPGVEDDIMDLPLPEPTLDTETEPLDDKL